MPAWDTSSWSACFCVTVLEKFCHGQNKQFIHSKGDITFSYKEMLSGNSENVMFNSYMVTHIAKH
jgi:hypothetical protein